MSYRACAKTRVFPSQTSARFLCASIGLRWVLVAGDTRCSFPPLGLAFASFTQAQGGRNQKTNRQTGNSKSSIFFTRHGSTGVGIRVANGGTKSKTSRQPCNGQGQLSQNPLPSPSRHFGSGPEGPELEGQQADRKFKATNTRTFWIVLIFEYLDRAWRQFLLTQTPKGWISKASS